MLLQRYVLRPRVFGLAAEVAFWLFLSLLPLVAVAGMLAAKLVLGDGANLGPWLGAVPDTMRALVKKELSEVIALRDNALGPLGAIVYVWLASSGVHALFDAFESMSGTSRGWVHKRAVALLSCLGLSLGGAALAVLTGAVQRVRSLIDASVSAPDGMELLVRALLGAALVFAIAGCLYAVGVPTHTRQRLPIVPGAALATVLQAALVVAYGALVRVTGDGSAYLAGLSAIAATMTSVYLHVLALLLGFALNQGWSQSRAWSRLGHVAAQPLHDRAT